MIVRTAYVLFKLLPSVLALRRDRRRWAAQSGDAGHAGYQKNARRLLDAFVSLGPVYIKFGQWLSSRADILPHPYMTELSKLQDDVPSESFEKIRPVLEADLGGLDMFDSIEHTALSGASIGQVHRASLGGRTVVIKVKRPRIEQIVGRDLEVLKKILPLAMRFVDPSLRFSVKTMLAQFIETIHDEMDYTIESSNLKRIKESMAGHGNVTIPGVYDDLCSRNVLTMEYVPGIKVTDIEELDRRGIDRQKLVVDVHKVFFTMLLRNAVFHADPHPGNISVTDEGNLILYDYGMVGRLDDETRMRLVRLYLALVEKDPPRTVNAMELLGMLAPDFNRTVVERAMELTVKAVHGRKPGEAEVQGLVEIANRTMNRFPFVLPKHLALYMRMTSIIEGIYKTHRVEFKFVKVLRDILVEESLIKDAYIEELKYSFTRFAQSIDATISIAPELKRLIDENRSARRPRHVLLSGSILSAAVFVGSAIIYGPNPGLGIAGMLGSAVIMSVCVALGRR